MIFPFAFEWVKSEPRLAEAVFNRERVKNDCINIWTLQVTCSLPWEKFFIYTLTLIPQAVSTLQDWETSVGQSKHSHNITVINAVATKITCMDLRNVKISESPVLPLEVQVLDWFSHFWLFFIEELLNCKAVSILKQNVMYDSQIPFFINA